MHDDRCAHSPTDSSTPSPGAVRMARHRSRRKEGLRCLTIELRHTEVEALIRVGGLLPDDATNLVAIREALYSFLDNTLR
jgi:hypothetical protein